MLHTTFRLLKDAGACPHQYRQLAKHLGGIKKYGRDTPIPFVVGLDEKFKLSDWIWAFNCAWLPEQRAACHKIARLAAADFICHILPSLEAQNPGGNSTRAIIKTARAFVHGHATREQLQSAWGRCHAGYGPATKNAMYALETTYEQTFDYCEDEGAEYQWQRDRLRQYLEDPNTKPLPLPRKSRRKAA